MKFLRLLPIAVAFLVATVTWGYAASEPPDESAESVETPTQMIRRLKQEMALIKKERDDLRRKVRRLTAQIDETRGLGLWKLQVPEELERAMMIQDPPRGPGGMIRVEKSGPMPVRKKKASE